MTAPVSVVVLTFNEERNLPHCLDSVAGWAARIFVVDSGSTDRTVEIARARGAVVDVVPAYQTVMPESAREDAMSALAAQPHWILFTSSSTVNNCVEAAGRDALAAVRIASIGPVTSDTIRSHGLTVAAEASPYTIDGLIQAILR